MTDAEYPTLNQWVAKELRTLALASFGVSPTVLIFRYFARTQEMIKKLIQPYPETAIHHRDQTLMLFNIGSELDRPEFVKVLNSLVGKGVYASHPYPVKSVIGEITGQIFEDPYTGTDFTFEANDGHQLEPNEPFKYLNHSCQPNCEFDWIETPAFDGQPAIGGLFLTTLRPILAHEEFTIDYRWPASWAIPCQCWAPRCRGWVVDECQLDQVRNSMQN